MAEDELAESLAFQAQEYIPIPIDEAILDFIPLGKGYSVEQALRPRESRCSPSW